MLVVTVKKDEHILIGDIKIVVLSGRQGRYRVGIDAPLSYVVTRPECPKFSTTEQVQKTNG